MANFGDRGSWATRTSGLVLAPFRGIRFGAGHAGDLAAVTSPPYDVIDHDALGDLRRADQHNVVRLILPASGDPRKAGELFRSWQREGVLISDDKPALYGYEQRDSTGVLQRGLLGAVGLRPEQDGVILPHEDVMPGPVAGRVAVMRECEANLEPILLSYEGGGAASQLVETTSTAPPLAVARTPDGVDHRIWAIRDPELIAQAADDLQPRQALIADGHHRYAAYLRLQAEHRAHDRTEPGPWDFGLALLVDQRTHPLQVTAIHRVVTGLSLATLLQALDSDSKEARAIHIDSYGTDMERARRALAGFPEASGTASPHAFAITDGQQWFIAHAPRGAFDLRPITDSGVLHEVLLGRLLNVAEDRIAYLHDPVTAVRSAGPDSIAVLLNPVAVSTVAALARSGTRMPRKSTSFGPKPRTGFVMRALT